MLLNFKTFQLMPKLIKIPRRTLIPYQTSISTSTCKISNISSRIPHYKIKELFSKIVPIHFINVPKDKAGQHLGYCLAKLDKEQVEWLMKCFNGKKIEGGILKVEEVSDKIKKIIG
ncbi:hypothetical protein K502DRAFT_322924 [Neoconidiobolus thromboides FSU 785]|nr:hypothetical protein K502DRAFT_322924 [Neoconidiobolus thromboides FSU 785]